MAVALARLRKTLVEWLCEVGAMVVNGIGNQRGHKSLQGDYAMISTTDPESMTAEERRLEIVSILARGVLRRIDLAHTVNSDRCKTATKSPRKGLDVSAKTRLSVAPRPAG